MKDLPVRKRHRLKDYDYSQNGVYFVTFCVKDRHEMLGKIVGRDDPGAPHVELSDYGNIVRKYIQLIGKHYPGVVVDKYVIMTNHIHIIIMVNRDQTTGQNMDGAPRSSRPTNALIPIIIAALKKMINREIGFDMWQASYHDHIVRNENEYRQIWQYIDENPAKWAEDCYFNYYPEVL